MAIGEGSQEAAISLAAPAPAFTTTVPFASVTLRAAPFAGATVIEFVVTPLTVPTTRIWAALDGALAFFAAAAVFVVLTRLFSIS